jgi:glutamyl-tRNA synthetase
MNMTTGRLAPSPTGAQHVGNARTYLLAWLAARSVGGALSLRIEDIDSPRVKPGAARQAVEDLHWLGLDWDGDPVVQSDRRELYDAALARLQSLNDIYPCQCTRSDIEAAASAPHAIGAETPYPGTCRDKNRRPDGPVAWRFVVRQTPAFHDLIAGRVELDLRHDGGDFVVWKNNNTPGYQLAVVVDDAAMGITQIVRGDDLIPSTPRQLLIYDALGLTPPQFAHAPLVVGTDGRRLAKRHGDTRLSELRRLGVRPQALLGLLAHSCGLIDRIEPVAAAELLPLFSFEKLPKMPFVLTPAALAQIGLPAGAISR